VKLSRSAPLQHPLAVIFNHAIDVISIPLSPGTARVYRGTARSFLLYLSKSHPRVRSLKHLRRDPHVIGWLTYLRSQTPPLAPATYILRILLLRGIFQQIAQAEQLPELAFLLQRQDVPRAPQRMPRPLTTEQDHALQQELLRRNDLPANVFLLLRHTGMRIGEVVDLSFDCLHSQGSDSWAILVPLGKLQRERMVPVDASVCALVHRLRFFRSFEIQPADTFIRKLRQYFHEATAAAGIGSRIVPHQLRHTYATEMMRAGVALPAIMKILGHTSPGMTMLYLDIALTDLEKEFQRAWSQPRHTAPNPPAPQLTQSRGIPGIITFLAAAQNAIETYRRDQSDHNVRHGLDRIGNRLCKLLALVRKLAPQIE
jgi:integrase